MKISGCTIVRNAIRLNYPFEASVRSLIPICDEFIINCGDSEDSTLDLCERLQREFPTKVRLLRATWETGPQADGFQLRHQTDRVVSECKGDWCFYLQADEVVHEEDLKNIRTLATLANNDPRIDGLVFDYLHFYGNYDYVIRGRNWYRREVRLFKLGRDIRAFRDAQGFRKRGKRLRATPARARIFHYGYVRTPSSLATKANEMGRWWGESPLNTPEDTKLRNHVGLTRFTQSHPAVMVDRVQAQNPTFDPAQSPRRWNSDEIKNAITLAWEKVFPFRVGEFKNYRFISFRQQGG